IQNVGLIVSLRVIDQLFDQKQSIGSSSFCSSLVTYGRKISASISREWNFPESVVLAIEEQGSIPQQMIMSPLGSLLETGDYVSKIKILSDQQRLRVDDPDLIKGLSEKALACLNEMNELSGPTATSPLG
ncbi:MAG TPA: hypothetical protein VK832_21540, partial [Burkholderiaceae bacterium]|nr:hypothetical protein [Burkholderiaceae bacterium]